VKHLQLLLLLVCPCLHAASLQERYLQQLLFDKLLLVPSFLRHQLHEHKQNTAKPAVTQALEPCGLLYATQLLLAAALARSAVLLTLLQLLLCTACLLSCTALKTEYCCTA
jgi:hypothetical protein